jgi:sugar-specific transcriptional regulator TrmB
MREAKGPKGSLFSQAANSTVAQVGRMLRDLGFSSYAAQTFCAALRVEHATAASLILATGIPDSKIYYALEELVERGVLEVQAGKPKVYRVGRPKDVEGRLRRMMDEKHDRERGAVTKLTHLIEPLRAGARSPSSDLAFVVKGAENVYARAQSVLAGARKEVVMLSSEPAAIGKLEGELLKAARRRVRLRLAVPEAALSGEVARAAEVRSIVCACSLTLVVDGEVILTANRLDREGAYAITSTDEMLVRLGADYWDSPSCCADCA